MTPVLLPLAPDKAPRVPTLRPIAQHQPVLQRAAPKSRPTVLQSGRTPAQLSLFGPPYLLKR